MTKARDLSQTPNASLGFKNRIINGDCRIDQRNAGASVTPVSGQYYLDRWYFGSSQASKLTAQQNQGSVTPPTGFTNYFGFTSSSAYSILSTDYFLVEQPIEGLNCSDLAWGTANASAVTLSFWVRSSLTGTFGGAIRNSAANRSYPFSYTISSANTWEQKSITIAGDTTGTWLTTNGIGIRVAFSLGSGSTYNGTAGSWSGSNLLSATGATSVVGTNGATFYITGVQLEKGSTATSWDTRSYGTELALCQRYFNIVPNSSWHPAVCWSTNRVLSAVRANGAWMRATPTVSCPSNTFVFFSGGGANTSTVTTSTVGSIDGNVSVDITVAASSGASGSLSTNETIRLSAEL